MMTPKHSQQNPPAPATGTQPINYWSFAPDGTITSVGGPGFEVYGADPDTLLGQNMWEVCAECPRLLETMDRLARGRSIHDEPGIWRGRHIRSWASPEVDAEGNVVRITGFSLIGDRVDAPPAPEPVPDVAYEIHALAGDHPNDALWSGDHLLLKEGESTALVQRRVPRSMVERLIRKGDTHLIHSHAPSRPSLRLER